MVDSQKPCEEWDINKAREIIHFFIKHLAIEGVTAFIVYVNDIIVRGNDPLEKESLKKKLAVEFEIKDLGKLKYFLCIEVA